MKTTDQKAAPQSTPHQAPVQMKSLAPPALQLQASPIQRDEDTAAPPAPTSDGLLGPGSGLQVDPELWEEMMLTQRLRQRTPFGGRLPEEWLLSMWSISPDATYDWDNGESGRMWDLLSGADIEDQMLMMRMLRERYPTDQGWRFGLNGQGLGPSYRYGENELNFGLSPYTAPDPSLEFPYVEPNEDAPAVDGGVFGIGGTF